MTNAEWLEQVELCERDEATRVLPTGVCERLRPIAAELRAKDAALSAADAFIASLDPGALELGSLGLREKWKAAFAEYLKVSGQ